MDLLSALTKEQAMFVAYIAVLGAGSISGVLIHRAAASFNQLLKRVRKVEFWLARQFGYNPDGDDE